MEQSGNVGRPNRTLPSVPLPNVGHSNGTVETLPPEAMEPGLSVCRVYLKGVNPRSLNVVKIKWTDVYF